MRHTLAAGSLPFTSLNQANLKDAACLLVEERGEMDAPVQFLFLSTSGGGGGGGGGGGEKSARVSHPRLAVIARKRSSAKFVQCYIDVGGGTSHPPTFFLFLFLFPPTQPPIQTSSSSLLTHPPTHLPIGVGLQNACTSVRCERRAEVQHLHAKTN